MCLNSVISVVDWPLWSDQRLGGPPPALTASLYSRVHCTQLGRVICYSTILIQAVTEKCYTFLMLLIPKLSVNSFFLLKNLSTPPEKNISVEELFV